MCLEKFVRYLRETLPHYVLAVLLISTSTVSGCELSGREPADEAASADAGAGAYYRFGAASRDGIGKFYMGREISRVMGHRGAAWLERPDREGEERTDLLVANLPLEAGDVVADIGAGTGYFSFRIAGRVPHGKVFAVDIQQQMLDIVELRKRQGAPGNVETVLGSERDPGLPEAGVDLILLVDAYHEFSCPREMGEAMARALRPGGWLVLIEYRGEDPSVAIKPLHKMTATQSIAEMNAIGLEWVRTGDFLPQQHFLVFRRPGGATATK